MPPNEVCPICRAMVPDWHREWHSRNDQLRLFNGTAGMERPFCLGIVMHSGWQTPLVAGAAPMDKLQRGLILAAYWATSSTGKGLGHYLQTKEGQPFARFWSHTEVLD